MSDLATVDTRDLGVLVTELSAALSAEVDSNEHWKISVSCCGGMFVEVASNEHGYVYRFVVRTPAAGKKPLSWDTAALDRRHPLMRMLVRDKLVKWRLDIDTREQEKKEADPNLN